ncbi:MAG: hypothetical protein V1772_10195 [Chloroflexota bacterium]
MSLQGQLTALVESVVAEAEALRARLSDAQRADIGQPDVWSAKDNVAHIAMWALRLADQLAAAAEGGPIRRHEEYEAENALDFLAFRDWSWEKVLQLTARQARRLVGQISARDDAALRATDAPLCQDGRPLWRVIAGGGYVHPVSMHLTPLYIALGYPEAATALAESAAAALGELDDSPAWRGMLRYNLACHRALLGERERALADLRAALALAPELAAHAQSDADLASLREDPAFLALVAG